MEMTTPPQEDSRDRRRRQNRESQRRWRERYRQLKHDDAKKRIDTPAGADETLLAGAVPPIPDLLSMPPLKHSPGTQNFDGYFDQSSGWAHNQASGQPDSHGPWQPLDFPFSMHNAKRCASTPSQDDELSREGSTSGFLDGLEKALAQPSISYAAASQIPGRFSSLPSCHSAPLTPPAAPSSVGTGMAYQQPIGFGAQCRETETASAAEEAIRDVQLLYTIGVKAGCLKRDDRVKYYLAAMRRTYKRVSSLVDEPDEAQSPSDLDELSDGTSSDGGKLVLPGPRKPNNR